MRNEENPQLQILNDALSKNKEILDRIEKYFAGETARKYAEIASRSTTKIAKKRKHVAEVKSSFEQDPEGLLPAIVKRATEVIGDRDEAMRWLGTPVRGLDYATPISLLATEGGADRVNDILGQMEHGVW